LILKVSRTSTNGPDVIGTDAAVKGLIDLDCSVIVDKETASKLVRMPNLLTSEHDQYSVDWIYYEDGMWKVDKSAPIDHINDNQ
jgi:hypothetical protein